MRADEKFLDKSLVLTSPTKLSPQWTKSRKAFFLFCPRTHTQDLTAGCVSMQRGEGVEDKSEDTTVDRLLSGKQLFFPLINRVENCCNLNNREPAERRMFDEFYITSIKESWPRPHDVFFDKEFQRSRIDIKLMAASSAIRNLWNLISRLGFESFAMPLQAPNRYLTQISLLDRTTLHSAHSFPTVIINIYSRRMCLSCTEFVSMCWLLGNFLRISSLNVLQRAKSAYQLGKYSPSFILSALLLLHYSRRKSTEVLTTWRCWSKTLCITVERSWTKAKEKTWARRICRGEERKKAARHVGTYTCWVGSNLPRQPASSYPLPYIT